MTLLSVKVRAYNIPGIKSPIEKNEPRGNSWVRVAVGLGSPGIPPAP